MVLVLLDLDQIKAFVYAAPMLRAIRGGSRILADFNDPDQVRRRVIEHQGTYIYAGGGSVLAKFGSREWGASFIEKEEKRLDRISRQGATFSYVVATPPEWKPPTTAPRRGASLTSRSPA